MANNGHERAFRLRPLYTRKRTFNSESLRLTAKNSPAETGLYNENQVIPTRHGRSARML